LQHHQVAELALQELDSIEIEIWSYDPALFGQDGTVDRLSLYLSLKDNHDERVESALDHHDEGNEMVKGLDVFRKYFRDFTDRYILIGGTACDLAMQKQVFPSEPRKTSISYFVSKLWMGNLWMLSGHL